MKFILKNTSAVDLFAFLAIILLPWQARWILAYRTIDGQPYEYGTIGIYAGSVVVVAAIFLLWHSRQAHPRMTWPAKVFFGWLLLSSLFANDAVLALWNLGLAVIAFGYFVIASSWERAKVIGALIAAGVAQAVIAWLQFIDQRVIASTFLGVAEHTPWVLGQSVVIIHGQRILRAYGLLPHPNMLAGILAVSLMLVVYRFIRNERLDPAVRSQAVRQKLEVLFLLLLSALLITFSRSALVSVLVIGFGWFAVALATGRLPQIRGLGRLFLLGLLLFLVFTSIAGGIWLERFGIVPVSGEQRRLETLSTSERLLSFHEAEVVLKPRTLGIGLGLGSFVPALAEAIPRLPVYVYQPVHAVPIMALLEIGVLGTAFLIWFLYSLLPKGIIRRGAHDILKLYPVSLVAVLLVIGLFDHYLWTSYFGQSLWWVVFGAAVSRTS
ncbi:MAG: hypothetical protein HY422_00740 [Candidatus Komeilibacteria bacterium]|nr:hypothetical protein [Candidatus Komeilibacteria bacterium]